MLRSVEKKKIIEKENVTNVRKKALGQIFDQCPHGADEYILNLKVNWKVLNCRRPN